MAAWLAGPLPVVVLVGLHLVLGLSAIGRKSMTFDESAHLGGGFSYWAANDYRLHAENGNWSQRWGALPIYLHGYKLAVDSRSWPISDVWGLTERLMATMGSDAEDMLRRARMMMAVPSAALALLVYFWSRRIFGAVGGVISLALYAFSPAMLANGFLVASDMPATLFFLAASASLWALLHRVSWITVIATLSSLAGLLLSKYSGVLIAPMALLLVVVRLANDDPLPVTLFRQRQVRGRWRQLLVFVGLAAFQILGLVLIIWASYGFRYAMFAPAWQEGSIYQVAWDKVENGAPPRLAAIVHFARDHHLLPEGYLYGFSYTLLYSNLRAGFLNGVFAFKGWFSFFPLCLLWKTPLTTFLIMGVAGWGLWACRDAPAGEAKEPRDWRRGRLYQLVPLIVLFGVYWIVALRSSLNIGHRHILPTYPPMFIFAGAAGLWFSSAGGRRATKRTAAVAARDKTSSAVPVRPRFAVIARGLTMGAMVIGAVETIGFWPNYLAYFNIVAGGPRHAYRRLVDSSLDWGQDLSELKRWLDAHPADSRDPRRVYLSYFGTAVPLMYDIRAQALPMFFPRWDGSVPGPLTGGLYCISASMLESVYTPPFFGRWNEKYEGYYQDMQKVVAPFQRAASDPAALEQMLGSAPPAELKEAFNQYRVLRFARLCSCLRQREPDDEIGYSILIYRLSDADIAAALEGPPCELLPEPEANLGDEPASDDAQK